MQLEGLAAAGKATCPVPLPKGRRIRFEGEYLVGRTGQEDHVVVRLFDLGPDSLPRKRRRGTHRDLDNIFQGLFDAWQGLLYANDNQIEEISLGRIVTPPS